MWIYIQSTVMRLVKVEVAVIFSVARWRLLMLTCVEYTLSLKDFIKQNTSHIIIPVATTHLLLIALL